MKITAIEDLHADGGWRTLSFLKITTDEGLVGWSEFQEGPATPGLAAVIRKMAQGVIGEDPRRINAICARLYATSRNVAGGMVAQAIAAIENACIDLKAKALGIPVSDLFGGAFHDRLPLYWSQCGTLRTRYPDLFGTPQLRSMDDIVNLGKEVQAKGFKALKTNVLLFEGGQAFNYRPGFGIGAGHPERNLEGAALTGLVDLLSAFREGAGPQTELLLDLNFNFRIEGVRRIARALEPFNLMWLELDDYDPRALAAMRESTSTPIASLESLYGRQALRPYLDASAVDVAIVDPQWNGLTESLKMASLVDSYDVNLASHNYHGQLSTLMGAHFSASIPNSRIVEFVVDEADWTRDFLTHPLVIESGELVLPTRPGWGSDIVEDAVRARPARAKY